MDTLFRCFSVVPPGGGAKPLAKPCDLGIREQRLLLSDRASRVFLAECACGKRYRTILVDVEAVPAAHRARIDSPKPSAKPQGRQFQDRLIEFNGVKILLTTGHRLSQVQGHLAEAEVVVSVYAGDIRVLKSRHPIANHPRE